MTDWKGLETNRIMSDMTIGSLLLRKEMAIVLPLSVMDCIAHNLWFLMEHYWRKIRHCVISNMESEVFVHSNNIKHSYVPPPSGHSVDITQCISVP